MENLTPIQALFNLLLWVIIMLVLRPALTPPHRLSNTRRWWGILLILIFCLFPFWGGDYFHYLEIFNDMKQGYDSSIESFYKWLIINVTNRYVGFRLIVWGIALLLLFSAYKRCEQAFDLSLFYFAALYLPWFSYARASLAMACVIFGATLLTDTTQKANFLSILLGLFIIGSSIFFHKSAILGILTIGVAYILKDLKKSGILLLFFLLPLAFYIISYLLNLYVGLAIEPDSEYLFSEGKIDYYLMSEKGPSGPGLIISNILNQTPNLLILIVFLIMVFNDDITELNNREKLISTYAVCIILIAISLKFIKTFYTDTLFYRTLYYAYPANAVLLMSIKSRNKVTRWNKIIFLIGIIGSAYALMYSVYLSTLN